MTKLWCGEDHEHRAIVATEPCGCIAGVSVIDHGEADAYRFAAKEARAGLTVVTELIEVMRERPWKCADHPNGPPWWKSNGGNGKRPADAPTAGLGL